MMTYNSSMIFFFFNDTATTEIYTLSLHDALPIWRRSTCRSPAAATASSTRRTSATPGRRWPRSLSTWPRGPTWSWRSEEHTSELQSRQYLVCRLLLEKKKELRHVDIITQPSIELQ